MSAAEERPGRARREDEQAAFRARRDAMLGAETGWLAVTGLTILPEGETPLAFGRITVRGDSVHLTVGDGVLATRRGEPIASLRLRPDHDDDVVLVAGVSHQLIRRGDTLALRATDPRAVRRRAFVGSEWFPVDPAFRVEARAIPLGTPRQRELRYTAGAREPWSCEYVLAFRLGGVLHTLEPVVEPRHLLLLFRDGTSGAETHVDGRYLLASLPRRGRTVLDFNQALSPAAAFTPHVICPVAPGWNRVQHRLTAGELRPRFSGDAG